MVRAAMVPPRGGRLAVGVAALVIFTGLTALVVADSAALNRFDEAVHAWAMAYGSTHPQVLSAMSVVTHVGDTPTLAAIDILLVGVCLVRRRRGLAGLVGGVAAGAWLVRTGLRQLIARPRPPDAFWPETMASYPSGHATNTTVMVGLALLVLGSPLDRRGQALAAAGGALLALAVGASRVLGGVHWPSDVVGGWLLGAGIVATAAWFVPRRPEAP